MILRTVLTVGSLTSDDADGCGGLGMTVPLGRSVPARLCTAVVLGVSVPEGPPCGLR